MLFRSLPSGGDAHASLEGGVLAALDTLLASPLPLDRDAQFYLDGKDVIKVCFRSSVLD